MVVPIRAHPAGPILGQSKAHRDARKDQIRKQKGLSHGFVAGVGEKVTRRGIWKIITVIGDSLGFDPWIGTINPRRIRFGLVSVWVGFVRLGFIDCDGFCDETFDIPPEDDSIDGRSSLVR